VDTKLNWKIMTLVCLAAALPFGAAAQKASPQTAAAPRLATVRAISRAPLPHGERSVIELSAEVRFAGERVPSPDRVYFDLPNAAVPGSVITAAQAIPAGPLVKTVRVAPHSAGTTRVVLELGGHPRYSAFVLYNPFRVVIDVESEPASGGASQIAAPAPSSLPAADSGSQPATAPVPPAHAPLPEPRGPVTATASAEPTSVPDAPKPPPLLTTRVPTSPPALLSRGGDYSLARQLGLGVARIVIDAGHGGHDPGAQANGIVEAELVLDVALRVEKLLQEQPGIEVVLTRRTDEFIPLEERTAIANREGADLFLSIHANASKRSAARGIETYFLNFATTPEAEAVAARENATSGRTMGNLPDLVRTITLNNKVMESRELATIVQTAMTRRLRQQNSALRDLGVKQAAFVVLIGAQMPSVLAEISFVTNKAEAALLKQPAYRQRIAQSLADGVMKYQGSLKKATTVAAKTE
jgi:N-acetylmuramoyl-L-alanine amidase